MWNKPIKDGKKRYKLKQPLKFSFPIKFRHFCNFSLSNTCSLLNNANTSLFFLVSNDRRWLGFLDLSASTSHHTETQHFCFKTLISTWARNTNTDTGLIVLVSFLQRSKRVQVSDCSASTVLVIVQNANGIGDVLLRIQPTWISHFWCVILATTLAPSGDVARPIRHAVASCTSPNNSTQDFMFYYYVSYSRSKGEILHDF